MSGAVNRPELGRRFWELFPRMERDALSLLRKLQLDSHDARESLYSKTCDLIEIDRVIGAEFRREAVGWLGVYDFRSGQGATVTSEVMEKWRISPRNVFPVPDHLLELAQSYPYGPCELKWLGRDSRYVEMAADLATNRNIQAGQRILELAGYSQTKYPSTGEREAFYRRLFGLIQSEAVWRDLTLDTRSLDGFDVISVVVDGCRFLAVFAEADKVEFKFTISIDPIGLPLRVDHLLGSVGPMYRVNHTKIVRDFGYYSCAASPPEYIACLCSNLIIYSVIVQRARALAASARTH